MKICAYCGKEFKRNNKTITCCSKRCGSKLSKGWPKPNEIGANQKYCPRCKNILDISKFYTIKKNNASGKRLHNWCSVCNLKHVNLSTRTYKTKIVEYMGGKCCMCGYNKCIHALDIHHKDPNEKDPNFKRMRLVLTDDLKAELKKCILVCSNCHREIHTSETVISQR